MENKEKIYPIATRNKKSFILWIIALFLMHGFQFFFFLILLSSVEELTSGLIIGYSTFVLVMEIIFILELIMSIINSSAFKYSLSITENGKLLLYYYNKKKVIVNAEQIYCIKTPFSGVVTFISILLMLTQIFIGAPLYGVIVVVSALMMTMQTHFFGKMTLYINENNETKKIRIGYIKDVQTSKQIILDIINMEEIKITYDLTKEDCYYE